MAGTWFDRHERFGDCGPNEVYIGCGVFAEFGADQTVRLRQDDGSRMRIDTGGINILSGAAKEWREKRKE